jgi:hypothetical protein
MWQFQGRGGLRGEDDEEKHFLSKSPMFKKCAGSAQQIIGTIAKRREDE